MDPAKNRKRIEKEFDPKLRELFESKSLDNLIFQIKGPGTRTECGFRVQLEVYKILDGPAQHRHGAFHHMVYLGYLKVSYNPKTTELPEFFYHLGKQLQEVYSGK
jgi:hypothetical protein